MNISEKNLIGCKTKKRYMNSLMQFDARHVVNHILPEESAPLPLCLRRMILEFSGHIRIGTKSFMYIFFPE